MDITNYKFFTALTKLSYVQEILAIIEDADTLLKIDCVRFDTLEHAGCIPKQVI